MAQFWICQDRLTTTGTTISLFCDGKSPSKSKHFNFSFIILFGHILISFHGNCRIVKAELTKVGNDNLFNMSAYYVCFLKDLSVYLLIDTAEITMESHS